MSKRILLSLLALTLAGVVGRGQEVVTAEDLMDGEWAEAADYPEATFSHKKTRYKYDQFGKTDPNDWSGGKEQCPFPSVYGLFRKTYTVYCPADSCFAERAVLALRCPRDPMLLGWLSERVCNYANHCPVGDRYRCENPSQDSVAILRNPSSAEAILTYYFGYLRNIYADWKCPGTESNGHHPPVEQEGLMVFDCWRRGRLCTLYEASWYDWASNGDNTREIYRTFDTRTGKVLTVRDFIPQGKQPDFSRLMMTCLLRNPDNRVSVLKERYKRDGSDVLALLDSCALVKEGLLVYFACGTLGCRADGSFEAIIPYKELKGILQLSLP